MGQWLIVLLIACAGGGTAIQSAINARIGGLASPVAGALLNFLVGAAILAPLALSGVLGRIQWQGFAKAPWWAYLGGLFGALFVTAVILAIPRIGAALTFGVVICAQLAVATLLDTYGLLGVAVTPLNGWRIAGLGFLLIGVVLMQRGSA